MKFRRILIIIALLSTSIRSIGQDALVRIYSKSSNGTSQGTGFFVSNQGQILTAYHVVYGAKSIEVINERLGTFANIQVDYVSPNYDVAVLQVLNSGTTPSIKLTNYAPNTKDDLEVQGYPLGDPYQLLRAYPTRSGLVETQAYNNMSGRRLFGLNIDVIPLGTIIYSGMSGGPVLFNGQAIGVLSGSYTEGGSIAWAIPCKYVNNSLKTLKQKPEQITQWEPLRLMDPNNWKSLRGMVRVNQAAASMSDEYTDKLETVAENFHELYAQAQKTFDDIQKYRPFLEKVAHDRSLDSQIAEDLLQRARDPLADSLRDFGHQSERSSKEAHDFVEVQMKLFTWIADESHIDAKSGRSLLNKAQAIVAPHKDMMAGLDAYLELDGGPIAQAPVNLAAALSRSRNSADVARALLQYLDAFQPCVNAYASPRALYFMTAVTGMERQIGKLMEPIVFQANSAQSMR